MATESTEPSGLESVFNAKPGYTSPKEDIDRQFENILADTSIPTDLSRLGNYCNARIREAQNLWHSRENCDRDNTRNASRCIDAASFTQFKSILRGIIYV